MQPALLVLAADIGSRYGGLKQIRASVLCTPDPWFGVAYEEDKQYVAENIRRLEMRGEYPERLWP